ncbi:hypothetical protein ABTM76_19915, partial [Acinetobacter baumannii]
MNDLASLFAGSEDEPLKPGVGDTLLTASEVNAALRRVPGRRLLLIDTCHSGAADGRNNPYSLA